MPLPDGWRDRYDEDRPHDYDDRAHEADDGEDDGPEWAPYGIGPDGCTYLLKDPPEELANFCAGIVTKINIDDGSDLQKPLLRIILLHRNGLVRTIEVTPADYKKMLWPLTADPNFRIRAGSGNPDKVREAVQYFSRGRIGEETRYTALGWRKTPSGDIFVHGGGAIGANGPVADAVSRLPVELDRYVLPVPTLEPGELRRAVRASISLLDVAPDRITVPLLGQVIAPILGQVDHGVHIAGSTGVFKSELAALAQQHFGSGLDARHFAGSWTSSDHGLECLAYHAKDVLFVVDDFCPLPGRAPSLHRKADRLYRAVGNGSARSRLDRPATPPRCALLTSGEEIPSGHSCRARMLALEVQRGDVDLVQLTSMQSHGRDGTLAMAIACFIRAVADQRDSITKDYAELVQHLVATHRGPHARSPGIAARLHAALTVFLSWARDQGAIDHPERESLQDRVLQGLQVTQAAQVQLQLEEDPAVVFLEHLRALLATRRAYLRDLDGGEILGERSGTSPGAHIGWLDRDSGQALLVPSLTYKAIRGAGAKIGVKAETLGKRLRESGVLLESDPGHSTARRRIDGRRLRVWVISDDLIRDVLTTDSDDGSVSDDGDGTAGTTPDQAD